MRQKVVQNSSAHNLRRKQDTCSTCPCSLVLLPAGHTGCIFSSLYPCQLFLWICVYLQTRWHASVDENFITRHLASVNTVVDTFPAGTSWIALKELFSGNWQCFSPRISCINRTKYPESQCFLCRDETVGSDSQILSCKSNWSQTQPASISQKADVSQSCSLKLR